MDKKKKQTAQFLNAFSLISHELSLSIQGTCDFIGISRSMYYKVKNGVMDPSRTAIKKIHSATEKLPNKYASHEERAASFNTITITPPPEKDELAVLIPHHVEEQNILRRIEALSLWLHEPEMKEGAVITARKLLNEYFKNHADDGYAALKEAAEELLEKTVSKDTVATSIRILDEVRSSKPSADRLLSRMWHGLWTPPDRD